MQYSHNKYTYFATRFHLAIAGLGTEDRSLERVTVARCEIDMGNIKDEFQRLYGKSLHTAVSVSIYIQFYGLSVNFILSDRVFQDDTSGNYRRTLLALIDGQ